jgi:hypothetical protein
MTRPWVFAVLLSAAALAACGNDTESTSAFKDVKTFAASAVKGKKDGAKKEDAGLTRAALDAAGVPSIRASIKNRGAVALLGVRVNRGDLVTWETSDGSAITLRQGLLIETRGLGADLMSAAVPSPAQLVSPGGTHTRVHYYLDGEDNTIRRDYSCEMSLVGPETIEIVERSYATIHVTETCRSAAGKITNQYWFESNGNIRQSLQWVSRGVGYLKLEELKD